MVKITPLKFTCPLLGPETCFCLSTRHLIWHFDWLPNLKTRVLSKPIRGQTPGTDESRWRRGESCVPLMAMMDSEWWPVKHPPLLFHLSRGSKGLAFFCFCLKELTKIPINHVDMAKKYWVLNLESTFDTTGKCWITVCTYIHLLK